MNWNIRIEVTLSHGESTFEILRLHVKEFVHEVNARKTFSRLETLITSLVALLKGR